MTKKYYEKLHNNKFHGCMVYPPEKIIELEPNYIISMVKNNHQGAHNAIKNYLKKQKLEEKLLPDLFM